MASLNRVVLIGNLTRDPELRFTPNGSPVANIGLAVNRTYTNKQGEKVQSVDFFTVVVWAKLAELCAEYLKKGSPIAVEGRLQSRSWEKEDGTKRSVVEVVGENVQFLGRPGAGAGSDSSQGEPGAVKSDNKENETQNPVEEIDLGDDIPF
ncbi:MAG TPA: single-stranded DNA-binding protein [Actinobacteria bacterium]|nr:single-stranded DNA-binding protein [Actinomycetota bacterium]